MKQSKTFASGFPVEEAIETLRQQLAEKDAEIERLNSKLQKQALDCIAADGQAFDSWQQLAASQAREQQLLKKVENYKILCQDENHYSHYLDALEALAIPQDTTALEAMIVKAAKESNDRLNEEREIWDRMFADGAKKLERLERELDDCLYVLDALWDKKQDKSVTQKWADILIRNKRATGASSAEDTFHPTTE